MRVIAGTARSLPLKAPEGLDTRPTTDRIKETLFNILQPEVSQSIFVDLFSGSGAIGIEALSRGAKKAYFIENSAKACKCIGDNLSFTKFNDCGILLKQDAISGLHSISEKYVDIIFMDPPYDQGLELQALKVLSTMPYVDENTLIIVEASLKMKPEELTELGYEITKEKRYKTNQHVFLRIAKQERR